MIILRLYFPVFWFLVVFIGLISSNQSIAANKRHVIENQFIKMVIIPRTAQQMAAFYEGREFPANAIKVTNNVCFFTVGISNKNKNILWLDTQLWQLDSRGEKISLITKNQWKQRWKKINLEQRFQSTFRWTLLPEKLGFQPKEREGGNITIVRQSTPFNLIANFNTVVDGQTNIVSVKFKNITCAKDSDK